MDTLAELKAIAAHAETIEIRREEPTHLFDGTYYFYCNTCGIRGNTWIFMNVAEKNAINHCVTAVNSTDEDYEIPSTGIRAPKL